MFQLKKICTGIYLLSFDNHVELCSHFIRFQEMYESPSSKFRSKSFELIDYITWYTKKNAKDDKFTYFDDWSGFNIPLKVITEWKQLSDTNNYDRFMLSIAEKIERDAGTDSVYLIGCKSGDETAVEHEIAHGLYYTDGDYRNEMTELIESLPLNLFKKCCNSLKKMGYDDSVLPDEVQAYFSTGLPSDFPRVDSKYTDSFIKLFKKYIKKHNISI